MVSPVILVALLSAYTHVSLAEEPIVTTTRGKVRGASLAPLVEVNQFLGIPYAKQGRFEEAVQYPAWSGIRNATKHGASCPQSQCKKFSVHQQSSAVVSIAILFIQTVSVYLCKQGGGKFICRDFGIRPEHTRELVIRALS